MRNMLLGFVLVLCVQTAALAADIPSIEKQPTNTWVKRSPLPDGPPSPRLGYEASWGYDSQLKKMIRWGGHDPGGGGPQLSETWTYDVLTSQWALTTPNNNPPGNCCCRENAMDPTTNRFYRFSHPAFGHGWMWDRSRYLREDSVWAFDLGSNTWTNMRPGKEPKLNVGKPVFWDPNHGIFWVYDTKLRAYDPYTNTWFAVNESTKVTGSDKGIGKRTYAGMALHPLLNKIVLYGDHYQADTRTLVYDIAKDEWIDMKPEGGPTSARATPTMVYDSINNIMVCVMQSPEQPGAKEQEGVITRKMETWTYDLAANKWTKMNPPTEPDNGGNRDKLLAFLPDLNIFVFEARTNKEQQIWTYRYLTPPVQETNVAAAPTDLSVSIMEGGKTRLTWKGAGAKLKYNVYRGEGGDQPWKVKFKLITPQPIGTEFLVDANPEASKVNYYCVANVVDGKEGLASSKLRTQPHLILDSRVDVLASDKVVYSWKKSADPDIVGYVVERAQLRPISAAQKVLTAKQYGDNPIPLAAMAEKGIIDNWVRLTPKPIAETQYEDRIDLTKKVPLNGMYWQALFAGKTKGAPASQPEDDKNFDMTKPGCPFTLYCYRVKAVNKLGVEGGPSPYQITVPNEVDNLFTKEDGKDVQMKWQASPHAGIKGYYVYRLDDRYTTVSLLTPEPIKDTTFTDKKADGKTRRYYVVVVDAVGQQGIPTFEAWGFREYSNIYSKFAAKDGWHQ